MIKNNLLLFLRLIKVTVSLPVTFLCFAGFYLHAKQMNATIWLACAGVFLLSAASSALNQIIEKKYDAIMERTKNRPLPAGKITTKSALVIVIILTLLGTALLFYLSSLACLLGLLAIAWYILIYTLLKRKTPFATIPGALTGALPLLIGWTASGGSLSNPNILVIAAFIFIWQIPHFWLLMIIYNNDYENAGFPTLQGVFSGHNIKFWTLCWIIALAIYALGFVPFGILTNTYAKVFLLLINGLLIVLFTYTLFKKKNSGLKELFHLLNIYMLAVITLIIVE